jgi:hypothetical protein
MPTYKVSRDLQDPRVVEAPNPAAARNHVANDEITVTKIGAKEAFELMAKTPGLLLETAGEAAPEPKAEPQKQEPFDSGEEELEGN